MSVLSEKIAAAKAAPRPNSGPVSILVGDEVMDFIFYELPGDEWGRITASHPAVSGSLLAVRYGYDPQKVALEAARVCGFAIVDGAEVKLDYVKKANKNDPTVEVDEWGDLFDGLDGHSFGLIADAIWYVNEWNPQQRIAKAKKA